MFKLRAGVPIAVACTVVLAFLLFQSSWTELATLADLRHGNGVLPWRLARAGQGCPQAR